MGKVIHDNRAVGEVVSADSFDSSAAPALHNTSWWQTLAETPLWRLKQQLSLCVHMCLHLMLMCVYRGPSFVVFTILNAWAIRFAARHTNKKLSVLRRQHEGTETSKYVEWCMYGSSVF